MLLLKFLSFVWVWCGFLFASVVRRVSSINSVQQLRPNIIFFLGDEVGWADVGFHNEGVLTPNLNELATTGLVLNRHYVQRFAALCLKKIFEPVVVAVIFVVVVVEG